MAKKIKSDATLEQRLAGHKAELDALEIGLADAIAERDQLESMRPEIASRALLDGDLAAKDELKEVGARLLNLADVVIAHEFDATRCRAQIAAAEAEIAEAGRAAQAAERDRLLRARDSRLVEAVKLIAEAGVLMEVARGEHRAAVSLWQQLNPQNEDEARPAEADLWRTATRGAMSAVSAHLSSIDLDVVSRTSPGEARRRLAAAAPAVQ